MKISSPALLLSFSAGLALPCRATLEDYKSLLALSNPAATHLDAVSGVVPLAFDVGALDGDRTFEFIVNAGSAGASGVLLGGNGQAFKFEQWPDTLNLGMTTYGVADYNAQVPAPLNEDAYIVYVFDGTDTHLYVNGALVHTFSGIAVSISGLLGISGAYGGGGFGDFLDGNVLAFAAHDRAVPEAEIAARAAAFDQNRTSVSLTDWQNEVTTAAPAPATTHFEVVSGLAPIKKDVGELSGDRSFEFIVNAGGTSSSAVLLGLNGKQALKFEQFNNLGTFGITDFGLADHDSAVPAVFNKVIQVGFASNGADTRLYVNGELKHTFTGVPLMLSGEQGLAALANVIEPETTPNYFDRLDGSVLRFASYDSALSDAEIAAHAAAFAADAGTGLFTAWQTAVTGAGTGPTSAVFSPVPGSDPILQDVGVLTGDRAFEFIVNAGNGGDAGTLMGIFGAGTTSHEALKFEQWQNTGVLGITKFGITDLSSTFPSPLGVTTHIVYSSDGTDTHLYADGVLQYTFAGTALAATGQQAIAAGASLANTVGSTTYLEPIHGHVLGFASYDTELSGSDFARHYQALTGTVPGTPDFRISEVSRNAVTGQITLSWISDAGSLYGVYSSTGTSGFTQPVVENIPGGAGTTTTTFTPPAAAGGKLFFVVKKMPPS